METVYKSIPGFDRYTVGDDGTVWTSTKRCGDSMEVINGLKMRKLRPGLSKRGYLLVSLNDGLKNRTIPVHVVVLLAFDGPKPEGCETRHLDGCRSNNRLDNLVWGTRKENSEDRKRHGTHHVGEQTNRAKLTSEDVAEIRSTELSKYGIKSKVAKAYGISRASLYDILLRRTWSHL